MKLSKQAKNAILIGTMCSVAYLAVYIARNTLSAVTPFMEEDGFDKAFIGKVSSIYFILYAIGQLINGAIGDKIRAKYMITFGLLLSGVCNIIFLNLAREEVVAYLAYGAMGFFLAMIYGPMTKIVSENTEPVYTTRCCLGYTFASFLGSPAAGILASLIVWQGVFVSISAVLIFMAIVVFISFSSFERTGLITYGKFIPKTKGVKNVKLLFKRGIVKFSIISILTGIVRTSVVFWMPTYFTDRLGFDATTATTLFAIVSFVISFTAFVAIFVYERLKSNINVAMTVFFSFATVLFLLLLVVQSDVANVVFLGLAIMGSGASATMLFSRYCPSLRDTGLVSSVTGFIDFVSYMAAAFANLVFPGAVESIGWSNLILIWAGLMLIGVIISLPYGAIFKKKISNEN